MARTREFGTEASARPRRESARRGVWVLGGLVLASTVGCADLLGLTGPFPGSTRDSVATGDASVGESVTDSNSVWSGGTSSTTLGADSERDGAVVDAGRDSDSGPVAPTDGAESASDASTDLDGSATCDAASSSVRVCGEDGNVYQPDACGNPVKRVAECPGDCIDGACRCVIRVGTDGNDLRSGITWATAKRTIQNALDEAASERCEVWLQAGSYRPWVGGVVNRFASFVLREGVALYGGFAGTETSRDERDWTNNLTYLEGGENAETQGVFHVLQGANLAHLDGVVIVGGNANDAPDVECGGGLLIADVDQSLSNVTFRDNVGVALCSLRADLNIVDAVFEGNKGDRAYGSEGSALRIDEGTVSITRSSFLDNGSSQIQGGPVAITNGRLTVESSRFEGNAPGGGGGAIYSVDSELVVRRSQFVNNVGGSSEDWNGGGAIYARAGVVMVSQCDFRGGSGRAYGGAIAMSGSGESAAGSLIVHNSRFIDNLGTNVSYVGRGGAIYTAMAKNVQIAGSLFYGNFAKGLDGAFGGAVSVDAEVVQLVNNTFVNNKVETFEPPYGGGAVAVQTSIEAEITNCLFWNNAADVGADVYVQNDSTLVIQSSTFSNDAACSPAADCVVADPQFLNVAGMDFTPTSEQSIHQGLTASLPADVMDLDDDGDVEEPMPLDLLGNARVVGAAVDIGAIEAR